MLYGEKMSSIINFGIHLSVYLLTHNVVVSIKTLPLSYKK